MELWALVIIIGLVAAYFTTRTLRKPLENLDARVANMEVSKRPRAETSDDDKLCPRCAETVKGAAAVCRFCGHEFAPSSMSKVYIVVLTDVGTLKIDVIQLARKQFGWDLKLAVEKLEQMPVTLARHVSEAEALRLKGMFEGKGATMRLD